MAPKPTKKSPSSPSLLKQQAVPPLPGPTTSPQPPPPSASSSTTKTTTSTKPGDRCHMEALPVEDFAEAALRGRDNMTLADYYAMLAAWLNEIDRAWTLGFRVALPSAGLLPRISEWHPDFRAHVESEVYAALHDQARVVRLLVALVTGAFRPWTESSLSKAVSAAFALEAVCRWEESHE